MTDNQPRSRKRVIRRQYSINAANAASVEPSSGLDLQESLSNPPAYARKKPGGLICSVCDGPAHGYNFDAITCESCKAFFRRNALKSEAKFKCRANHGQCIINITTRKRCKACRLAKCFQIGMRADWILTDEERQSKRQKIEENRRLRQLLYPDSSDTDDCLEIESATERNSLLSPADLLKIEHVQQAYRDSVRLTSLPSQMPSFPHTARLTASWEMVNVPTNIQATRVITYFKLLPEFSSLNEHDKLILIKYNTFTLAFIRAALNYDRRTDSYHEQGTDDCVFEGKDLIQCFSFEQYEKSTRCVCRILEASQNDRLLIQIFLVIVVFSKGILMCTYTEEAEPIAYDILSIHRAQSVYVDLLWKYCEQKFGSTKSTGIWLKLVTALIDANVQSLNTINNYVKNDLVVDRLVPLMKSVMLIT